MDVYASESQYVQGPTGEQQAKGTIPLDTLPADWWNWLWKSITERINQASAGMESLYEEILSVLTAASIEPSQPQSDQLLNAIRSLARTTGTSSVAGAVKSSTDSGKVSIDESGIMTVNGLGIPTSLNTTAKNIVNAINEILSEYTSNKTTTDASITGLQNSKAPTNHASAETTYGKGTSSVYGHVKLYDGVDSASGSNEGIAATPAAVKTVNDELQVVKAALTIPTGFVAAYAGATPPEGWLLCRGQQVAKASYPALYKVIGTTYNLSTDAPDVQSLVFRLPDLRETVPVGIGERGSGTSRHDALTLGQFKDDTYQSHTHNYTPSGIVSSHSHGMKHLHGMSSHTHNYTPSGSVSSHVHHMDHVHDVDHIHRVQWSGSHTHARFARTGTNGWNRPYLSGAGISVGWIATLNEHSQDPYNNVQNIGDATISIDVTTSPASGKYSGLVLDLTPGHNRKEYTAPATPTFTGTNANTSSPSVNETNYSPKESTDIATPTFTGIAGTTGSNGSTVTKGKSLGMNYIIKT